MTSVFEPTTVPPEPPTWEEFRSQVGDPALTFTLEQGGLEIPNGLLACCRVVHQAHCAHHVAVSLVGCRFSMTYPDGEVVPWEPLKQEFLGDVLARPRDLGVAVQMTAMMVKETAEASGGSASGLTFEIWLLDLTQAEMWRYLKECQAEENTEILEAGETWTPAEIEALPIQVLTDPAEAAKTLASPGFKPVAAYARRVMALPSEIGHTKHARYITQQVWGDPDEVPASVEAILADPFEQWREHE